MDEREAAHEKADEEDGYRQTRTYEEYVYGAYDKSDSDSAEDGQGSPSAAISISMHAAVLAPAGRAATHVPPPAAQAASQLWPPAPSCQEMPLLPHAQSPPGRCGGSGGDGGRGGSGGRDGGDGGGDGAMSKHGQTRWW